MDTSTLLLLQLQLECIRLNSYGYLEAFQCNNPDELARLYVYQSAEGYYRYLRHDVSSVLRQHLKLLREERLFSEHELVQQILSEDFPSESIFQGRTYIFPPEALAHPYEDTEIIFGDSSFCGISLDGAVVASCSSVREDGKAAEAWVHTEEAYRGRGLGRRVSLAWARRISEKGKLAFYSHAIPNPASQALVENLPFVWVYDLVSYA